MPVLCECHNCHQVFTTSPSRVQEGKDKYCSVACRNISRFRLPNAQCRACGKEFVRYTTGAQVYCSDHCRYSYIARAQRFWQKVARCLHGWDCPYCCWLWQGTRSQEDYGLLVESKDATKNTPAHRMAWALWHNRPMPELLLCAHYCHTPACCNPHHLHMGTQKDNRADSVRDHRTAWGEKNHAHKLTSAQVLTLLHRWNNGENSEQLGRTFHISSTAVLAIVHRKTWRRVTDAYEIRVP